VILLKLLALGVLSYVVGEALQKRPDQPLPSRGFLSLTYGLIVFTLSFIFLLIVELWSSRLAWALIIGTALFCIRSLSFPKITRWTITSVAVFCFGLAPIIVGHMHVGLGNFPTAFYNIDNAFFLQFVFSLVESEQYPPPTLGNYGAAPVGYHYGAMALGALISKMSGALEHISFLLIVTSLGFGYLIVVMMRLVHLIGVRSEYRNGLVALLVLAGNIHLLEVGSSFVEFLGSQTHSVALLKQNLSSILDWRSFYPRYNNPFATPIYEQHIATIFGLGLSLDILGRTITKSYIKSPALFIILVAALPVFKLPFILPISLGIATFATVETYRTRQFQNFWIPAVAGVAMVTSFLFFGGQENASPRTWSIGWQSVFSAEGFKGLSQAIEGLVLWILLVFAMKVQRKSFFSTEFPNCLLFISPLLLVPVFTHPTANLDQIYTVPTLVCWLLFWKFLVDKINDTKRARIITSIALPLLVVFHLQPVVLYTRMLWQDETWGHDYANNRDLAEVLEAIPVEGSLIVSNDLNWPSKKIARKETNKSLMDQFQLTGIFGHKSFNSSLRYSPLWATNPEILSDKYRVQDLLRDDVWHESDIEHLLEKYPITHFVVRKDEPHAEVIPRPVISRSDEYVVYQLQ